jgi:hypothetical protein
MFCAAPTRVKILLADRHFKAHAWKFCLIPLAVIADMNERKPAFGNERRFQSMRKCDQTCSRQIGRMKHSANDGLPLTKTILRL